MPRLALMFGSVVTPFVVACALGVSPAPPVADPVGLASKALFEPTKRGQVFQGLGQYRADNLEHIELMPAGHRPAFTTVYAGPGDRRTKADPDFVVRKFGERIEEEFAAGRFLHLGIDLLDNSEKKLRPIIGEFIETEEYDELIVRLAKVVAEHGIPVMVRPLFEFNSEKHVDHKKYVAGYRKIVRLFREAGAGDLTAFCWCFEPRAGPGRFMDWYPGDDVVDWFGLDIFGEKDVFTDQQTRSFLREADRHDRPVFLAEVSCNRVPIGTTKADAKRAIKDWFKPFADFVDDHDQIKGFAYITTDHTKRGKYGEAGWLDSRLQNNPTLLEWWRDWIEDEGFVGALGDDPGWGELSGMKEILAKR